MVEQEATPVRKADDIKDVIYTERLPGLFAEAQAFDKDLLTHPSVAHSPRVFDQRVVAACNLSFVHESRDLFILRLNLGPDGPVIRNAQATRDTVPFYLQAADKNPVRMQSNRA